MCEKIGYIVGLSDGAEILEKTKCSDDFTSESTSRSQVTSGGVDEAYQNNKSWDVWNCSQILQIDKDRT